VSLGNATALFEMAGRVLRHVIASTMADIEQLRREIKEAIVVKLKPSLLTMWSEQKQLAGY
jgi:hypothetical protein